MAINDIRFGGNLERANTGIRSLPRRDNISYADRESYGYGQMMNPQGGARDTRYIDDDTYYNPDVFSRQMAVPGFPNAPREIINQLNFGGPFSSPANLREGINYINAVNKNPDLVDPMYRDLYSQNEGYPRLVFDTNPSMADLYKSKKEQMEDAGSFEALQMDRYARENPFLQMLEGTQTTDVTDPRGNVTTTEEIVNPGVYAMTPSQLSYMYGASNPGPLTTRPDQFYPDEQFLPNPYTPPSDRQPGINNPFMPSDRQPGLNNPFMPSDRQPGLDKFNGLTYPEGIGLDRAPEEILSAPEEDDSSLWDKVSPFIPPIPGMPWLSPGMAGEALDLFSPDDIYQDPIMDMAKFQEYEDRGLAPMNEFDMSEADSYSFRNLIQLYQDALDAGNEDEAEMYLNDLQLRYPTLV